MCFALDSRPIPIHFGKRACPYLDLGQLEICLSMLQVFVQKLLVFCVLTQMSEHVEHVSKAKLEKTPSNEPCGLGTGLSGCTYTGTALPGCRSKHQIRLQSLQNTLRIIDIVATMTTGEASKSGQQKLTEWN